MRGVTGATDRIIVVGAGLGGLSAALHLAGAGREVLILERDGTPGGRLGRISLGGYEFDTGPATIGHAGLLAEPLAAVGERLADWVELVPLDPAYRAHFPDGSTLDVWNDPARTAAEVSRVCGSREAAGYLRLTARLRALGRTDPDRLAPATRLRTLDQVLRRYLEDPRTLRALAVPALRAGLMPHQAPALDAAPSLLEGAYTARGGLHAVPVAIAGAAEKHGVVIRYGTAVRRIETYHGRARAVHTVAGERIPADVVVVNADLPAAHVGLLPAVPGPGRLDRLRHAPSCVVLHLGTARRYERIAAHNVHFGRSWRSGLGGLTRRGRLLADPWLEVANPTRLDPTLAPAGRGIYRVLVPVPHLDAGGPTAGDWRDGLSHRYAGELVATLEARGYLDLGADLEISHVVGPADWAARGHTAGSPYGPAQTLTQTGVLRPGSIHPRLSNVVFVGAGTRPGLGIPSVLRSGRLAARRITG
jgi:phytoene desaturase